MGSRAILLALPWMLGCLNASGPDSRPAPDAASREDALPADARLPTDAPPDATTGASRPDALGPGCTALGGFCVPGRFAICPSGTEPTADVHADCKPRDAVRGWFCCVPAPPSSCSSSGGTNCFAGSCHTCWGPANNP